MIDGPASLLLPGVLTVLLYVLAILAVVASRNATSAGPQRPFPDRRVPRGRPRLRVIRGGLPRVARRAP